METRKLVEQERSLPVLLALCSEQSRAIVAKKPTFIPFSEQAEDGGALVLNVACPLKDGTEALPV